MEFLTFAVLCKTVFIAISGWIAFKVFGRVYLAKKKLHVDYEDSMGGNLLASTMMYMMPKKLMIKGMAPKSRPLDVFEVLQKDPYSIKEIEEGRVWIISYTLGGGDPAEGKAFGMGNDEETYKKALRAARLKGDEYVEQLEKDWKLWKDYFEIDPKLGLSGEYCRKQTSDLMMVVVKLKSDDILLYCPVVIHNRTTLDSFLKELGTVKYIVIGSSFHTNYLPATTKLFPDAIVIGTTPAEIKLNAVSALKRNKLDFDLLQKDQLQDICSILKKEGVTLHFSEHEVMTNSVFLVAYNTACEVDLLYGHHDGCSCGYRHSFCDSIATFHPEDYAMRIFGLLMMNQPASPNGFLASYRFAAMDPTSTMSLISYPSPAPDGSSCKELAIFLRDILKLEFQQVACVHSHLQNAEDFRKSIDVAWNWLDNRSLIES